MGEDAATTLGRIANLRAEKRKAVDEAFDVEEEEEEDEEGRGECRLAAAEVFFAFFISSNLCEIRSAIAPCIGIEAGGRVV